jgi:hypothetical protein
MRLFSPEEVLFVSVPAPQAVLKLLTILDDGGYLSIGKVAPRNVVLHLRDHRLHNATHRISHPVYTYTEITESHLSTN